VIDVSILKVVAGMLVEGSSYVPMALGYEKKPAPMMVESMARYAFEHMLSKAAPDKAAQLIAWFEAHPVTTIAVAFCVLGLAQVDWSKKTKPEKDAEGEAGAGAA
jgi:hypothetical protein